MQFGRYLLIGLLLAGFQGIAVSATGGGYGSSAAVEIVDAAPDRTINLTNYEFSNESLSVEEGTVVRFENKEGEHTVTLDTAGIDRVLSPGESVTLRFNENGTYEVYCRFHGSPGSGMHSDVSVESANGSSSSTGGGGETVDEENDTTGSGGGIAEKLDDPTQGDSDAPVTLVEYCDFQGPFCKRFEENTMPKIKENYVETGKVRVVWRDFPLGQIHPWARDAARVMECVYRQDANAFWDVKDKIYANQDTVSAENVETKITDWAVEEGVSESSIDHCLNEENPDIDISEDKRLGKERGVSGTPTVFINGKKIVGAQPYSKFASAIDAALEQPGDDSCSYAGIDFYDVSYDAGTDQLAVSVANTGTIDLESVTINVYRGKELVATEFITSIASGDIEDTVITNINHQPDNIETFSVACPKVKDFKRLDGGSVGGPPVPRPGPSHSIQLNVGWNMVSAPFDTNLSQVTDDCSIRTYKGHKVWTFMGGEWSHPTTLQQEQGYYLYSSEQCTAELHGEEERFSGPTLSQGWNMISADGPLSAFAGDCTFEPFNGETIWRLVQGDWRHPGTLEPTGGYFVYAANRCTMGIPSPPTPGQ